MKVCTVHPYKFCGLFCWIFVAQYMRFYGCLYMNFCDVVYEFVWCWNWIILVFYTNFWLKRLHKSQKWWLKYMRFCGIVSEILWCYLRIFVVVFMNFLVQHTNYLVINNEILLWYMSFCGSKYKLHIYLMLFLGVFIVVVLIKPVEFVSKF